MAKKRNVFEDTGSDIKVNAAEKGAIEQGEAAGRGAVAVWLLDVDYSHCCYDHCWWFDPSHGQWPFYH